MALSFCYVNGRFSIINVHRQLLNHSLKRVESIFLYVSKMLRLATWRAVALITPSLDVFVATFCAVESGAFHKVISAFLYLLLYSVRSIARIEPICNRITSRVAAKTFATLPD
jgi:hypothetical protein